MRGRNVFVVGGGNSAGQAALHLAKDASSVTLLIRGDTMSQSMSSYLVRTIESNRVISVRRRTEVIGGGGRDSLEYLTLADRETDTVENVVADALFIVIGGQPHTTWLPDEVVRDERGYVVTGRDLLALPAVNWRYHREPLPLETSMPGVFAVGDVRHGSIKRIASAVGEGAAIVRMVHEHLSSSHQSPAELTAAEQRTHATSSRRQGQLST